MSLDQISTDHDLQSAEDIMEGEFPEIPFTIFDPEPEELFADGEDGQIRPVTPEFDLPSHAIMSQASIHMEPFLADHKTQDINSPESDQQSQVSGSETGEEELSEQSTPVQAKSPELDSVSHDGATDASVDSMSLLPETDIDGQAGVKSADSEQMDSINGLQEDVEDDEDDGYIADSSECDNSLELPDDVEAKDRADHLLRNSLPSSDLDEFVTGKIKIKEEHGGDVLLSSIEVAADNDGLVDSIIVDHPDFPSPDLDAPTTSMRNGNEPISIKKGRHTTNSEGRTFGASARTPQLTGGETDEETNGSPTPNEPHFIRSSPQVIVTPHKTLHFPKSNVERRSESDLSESVFSTRTPSPPSTNRRMRHEDKAYYSHSKVRISIEDGQELPLAIRRPMRQSTVIEPDQTPKKYALCDSTGRFRSLSRSSQIPATPSAAFLSKPTTSGSVYQTPQIWNRSTSRLGINTDVKRESPEVTGGSRVLRSSNIPMPPVTADVNAPEPGRGRKRRRSGSSDRRNVKLEADSEPKLQKQAKSNDHVDPKADMVIGAVKPRDRRSRSRTIAKTTEARRQTRSKSRTTMVNKVKVESEPYQSRRHTRSSGDVEEVPLDVLESIEHPGRRSRAVTEIERDEPVSRPRSRRQSFANKKAIADTSQSCGTLPNNDLRSEADTMNTAQDDDSAPVGYNPSGTRAINSPTLSLKRVSKSNVMSLDGACSSPGPLPEDEFITVEPDNMTVVKDWNTIGAANLRLEASPKVGFVDATEVSPAPEQRPQNSSPSQDPTETFLYPELQELHVFTTHIQHPYLESIPDDNIQFCQDFLDNKIELEPQVTQNEGNSEASNVHQINIASERMPTSPSLPLADSAPSASEEPKSARKKKGPTRSPYFTPSSTPSNTRLSGADSKTPKSSPSKSIPKSSRAPGGTVSCIPFPPLGASNFGLIQEVVCRSDTTPISVAERPLYLLIAVTFLQRTSGRHAIPVFWKFMEKYDTAQKLKDAKQEEITDMIRHLGLQNNRAEAYQRYAADFIADPPQKGRRHRVKDYPTKGSGRDIKKGEILDDDDSREAWEIGHITHGPYFIDSWRIFCRDVLRGLATGWNGEGAPEDFQPEWMRVQPADKELKAFLRWMWLKQRFDWDPITGDIEAATPELVLAAEEGRIAWDNEGELKILEHVKHADVPPLDEPSNPEITSKQSPIASNEPPVVPSALLAPSDVVMLQAATGATNDVELDSNAERLEAKAREQVRRSVSPVSNEDALLISSLSALKSSVPSPSPPLDTQNPTTFTPTPTDSERETGEALMSLRFGRPSLQVDQDRRGAIPDGLPYVPKDDETPAVPLEMILTVLSVAELQNLVHCGRLMSYSRDSLRNLCGVRNLGTTGTKTVLVEKITKWLEREMRDEVLPIAQGGAEDVPPQQHIVSSQQHDVPSREQRGWIDSFVGTLVPSWGRRA